MNRLILMSSLVMFIAACGMDEKNTYTLERQSNSNASEPDDAGTIEGILYEPTGMELIEIQGLDLVMHREPNADAGEQHPTFRIHADSGSTGENMDYALTGTRAIIYDDEGEEIVLTANTGDFDQKTEQAHLRGDVLVVSGDIKFTMDTITWDNTPELAYTDDGATLTSENADLTAEKLVINPNTNRLTMHNVSGSIKLEGLL